MSYIDDLKHPKWQRKRLEIMARDGWMCTCCKEIDKPLHVHHEVYLSGRKPWEYSNENLKTLCDACHKGYHKVLDYYADIDSIGKMDILLKILGPNSESARRGPFAFFSNPRETGHSIIFHVPSGLWRGFHLTVDEAVLIFDENPPARQELLGAIVASVNPEWADDQA